MTAHVEIQAGAVAQEDIAAAAPGHHAAEEVARHLFRRQPPLPAESASDAVFSLDPEYPPVHIPKLRAARTGVIQAEAYAVSAWGGPCAAAGQARRLTAGTARQSRRANATGTGPATGSLWPGNLWAA